jgi:hypothetical protein
MIKVICAGISRTGTMSLKEALNQLGYRSYHMEIALLEYDNDHLDMWNNFLEGKSEMDWQKLLVDYTASVDLPSAFFFRELMAEFPDAPVILTVREPDAWFQSLSKLIEMQNSRGEAMTFLPRFKEFQRLANNVYQVIFEGRVTDREGMIEIFNRHNEAVKAEVPPERLLVFDVREGWEPLCNFLGLPVPDGPFPHENIGTKTAERALMKALFSDLFRKVWPYLAGLVVVVLVLIYLLSR